MKNNNTEGCLTGSIVLIASLLLTAFILVGCSASKQVNQVVRDVRVDTIYLNNIQYDSIYIAQDKFVDRSRDTLYIQDKSVEYRYKLLRDTVRIVQRDSIPYEIRITEIREVKHIPWWAKALATIGSFVLTFTLISIIFKIARL